MAHLIQPECDAIARRLNTRPREPPDFLTPEPCYQLRKLSVLHFEVESKQSRVHTKCDMWHSVSL